jgi:hypothetical protein
VVVMTEFMRWVMGYISPSLVVVAGAVMAFLVHFGFPRDDAVGEEPVTYADLERLERFVVATLSSGGRTTQRVQTTRKGAGASAVQLPLAMPVTKGAKLTNGETAD